MSIRELCASLKATLASGRDAVYCCVVETRGSTPQKAGAVMVLYPDGSQLGTLGGGCVEAEVRQQSFKLFGTEAPALFTYTLDDDYGWDDGLICGGRMQFVAQPISAANPAPYFIELGELIRQGSGCTEAIVTDREKTGLATGARFLFGPDGELRSMLHADACPDFVKDGVVDLAVRPRPRGVGGVAYLPVLPRCRLLIVGAGHVGEAVAKLAHDVDFDVWVLDDREKFACSERFPHAEKILVGDIGRVLKDFQSDANTYGLIVTRGHSHDEEALLQLVRKPFRYLGMIGSRRKIRLIFEDLMKEGITADELGKVYAPLGIDIGSQTVPEIAVSIVAELIGHRNRGREIFPPTANVSDSSCTPSSEVAAGAEP